MGSGTIVPAGGQLFRESRFPVELTRNLPINISPALPVQDSVLREYLRTLIKRKWIVIASVLIIFISVTVATLRSTKIYSASGSIAINRSDPTLLTFKDGAPAAADYYDPTDLDTEVSILKSDLLALQVIKALNLDKR